MKGFLCCNIKYATKRQRARFILTEHNIPKILNLLIQQIIELLYTVKWDHRTVRYSFLVSVVSEISI